MTIIKNEQHIGVVIRTDALQQEGCWLWGLSVWRLHIPVRVSPVYSGIVLTVQKHAD